MTQWTRISSFASDGSGRVVSTYRYVRGQPSWVTRAALLVFLLVVGLPIVLLILLAFMLAVIVFGSLALVNAVVMRVRGVFASSGRENVRIIVRDERT
jgi:hypothetical protein